MIEHPVVTKLRKDGLPDAEPFAIDYYGTEIMYGEHYFRFEDIYVHEDNLEEFLYDYFGMEVKLA